MKHLYHRLKTALYLLCSLTVPYLSYSQSPGMIIRPATGSGAQILDPNGDGYTSLTKRGFTNKDTDSSETEVRYKTIKPYNYEPIGDLLRGPNGGFSDLVTIVDSSGFYVYSSGSYLLFRLRIGDYIPGSKGYSILVDTDGRMGYTGAAADPGFTPATNTHNGNPGFEYEVTLESNFRVAVYNVDTPGKTVLRYANTPVADFSQVSVSASLNSGNPDYFIDFYIPYAQLGINANTSLRMAATTVMSPQAAIGGTKSDIFGLNNSNGDYMSAWTQVVTYETPFTLNNLNAPGSQAIPVCTAPPTISTPAVGSTAVSGSWSRLDASKPATAEIRLYRNGTLTDSITATSGNGWSIPVSAVTTGQSFYAMAQATGEGACFQSNTVVPVKCTGAPSARPTITCSLPKGIDGTVPFSNTRVRIYQNVVPGAAGLSSFTLFADSGTAPANFSQVTSPFVLQDNATHKWKCDGLDGNGQPGSISNTACNGGNANDMPANATLAITAQEPGKCESMPVFICPNGTQTATPTLSPATLYPGSALTVSTVSNGYIRLYVDSVLKGAAYADAGGNYTFSNAGLSAGSRVDVCVQASASSCVSNFTGKAVSCYTSAPTITTDSRGSIAPGATSISGRSYESNGAIVTVYKKLMPTGTLSQVGQATVSNSSWSLNIAATVANERYIVVQQTGSCSLSDSSAAAFVPAAATLSCPAFSVSTYSSSVASVSGTVSPALTNGTVYLYIDGSLADSATGVSINFSINTNTTVFNRLYAGATLTATTRTSGGMEKTDCSPAPATVTCTLPAAATYITSASSILTGDSVLFTLSDAVNGLLYTITDTPYTGKAYGSSAFASGPSLQLMTYPMNTPGTYYVTVSAVNIAEGTTCRSIGNRSAITVSNPGVLPVRLIRFSGRDQQGQAILEWAATGEDEPETYVVQRSGDGRSFSEAGRMAPQSGTAIREYRFTDPRPLSGTTYYRLMMPGTQGTQFSKVVVVKAGTGGSVMSISPNPFSGSLHLHLEAARDADATVFLTDMTGRVLRSYRLHLLSGSNNITIQAPETLLAGTYLFRLKRPQEPDVVEKLEKRP